MKSGVILDSDAGCVIPKSMEIEFVNSRDGGGDSGAKIFEMVVRWCDEQYSKVIIGQTMTTDAGSSCSQEEVHYAVRGDLVAEDARRLESVVRDQLIRVVIQLNFGISVPLPWVRLASPLHEYKNELAKRAAIAVGIGLPLSRSKLYADLGLPEQLDAADALPPAVPAALSAAAAPVSENNTVLFAAGDAAARSAAARSAEWEEIADSDITVIKKLLNKSATAEEFLAAVIAAGINPQLAEALAGDTFAARVAGETGNDDD